MLQKYLVCYLLIALDQLHLHYVQCCALESEYKVSWLMLLLSPFHIRSIKYLFHSPVSLQLICSFMATFTAFPLQTRSSCSWDSFRSMGNEISKTQTAYIYTADRDRWPYFDDTAASDWWKRKPPIVRDQVLSVVARSCLADKSQTLPSSWPWHLSMPFNVSRSLNCKMYANAPSVGTIKRLLSKFLYNTLWWMLGPAVAEPWETAVLWRGTKIVLWEVMEATWPSINCALAVSDRELRWPVTVSV